MLFDTLMTPLSDDHPCGPDLEATDDDEFLEYYFEALAMLPERFYDSAGQPFDRKSLDLKGEMAKIGALLDRSRDLRLLSLAAQLNALGGNLKGFADCLRTMAGLLGEFPNAVNPSAADDATDRRNAIEMLDTRATVVLPLEYMPLIRDRRAGEICYMDYEVASGQKEPRGEEARPDVGTITSALKSADNADAVDAIHAEFADCAAALKAMRSACYTAEVNPFGPSFDNIEGILNEILGFLVEMRPDLAGGEAAAEGDGSAAEDFAADDAAEPGAAGAGGNSARPAPVVAGPIPNHASAFAALSAAESYFARREPSSPALVLLRQSRDLIGRPLTEAIRLLLPEKSAEARIDFGSDTGFMIGIDRMDELSAMDYADPDGDPPEEIPEVTSREQAQQLMSAVEAFFRQVEPSSPIPVLLFKAKTYISRDFSAIIADLLPPQVDPYA